MNEARKIGKARGKLPKSKWATWGFVIPSIFALGALSVTQACVHKIQALEDKVHNMATSEGQTLLCNSFKPIMWSDDDTNDTKKQIYAYNAGWDAICRKEDE